LQAAKDLGNRYFHDGDPDEASTTWLDGTLEAESIKDGSSWENLVKKGGKPFLDRIAETYFLIKLNVAHVNVSLFQSTGSPYGMILARDALSQAQLSVTANWWTENYKFVPAMAQRAKLRYRQALLWRLAGDPERVRDALVAINMAVRAAPGDAAIMKEKEAILEWMATFG
jgi:hypothetical protein